MAITADELAEIRDFVPLAWEPLAEFTDLAATAAYDRAGNVLGAVRSLLSRKLAYHLGQPDSFTIPGEYGESRGATVRLLKERLAEVEKLIAAGLTRPSEAGGQWSSFELERVGDPGR